VSDFYTCVNLASWANAMLAGRKVNAEPRESLLWARFLIEDGWNVFALGLEKWVAQQKEEGATRARIYMAKGGVGGYQPSTVPDKTIWWAATTVLPDKEYLWVPAMVSPNAIDPERMMVRRYELRTDAPWFSSDPVEAEKTLREELAKVIEFSRDQHLSILIEWFQRGLTALDNYDPDDPNIKRLSALGLYPPESRRLIQAVVNSWAFRGMASWYDVGSAKNDPRYDELTISSYRAMAQAVVAACDVKL
jgi:hypothetical protein